MRPAPRRPLNPLLLRRVSSSAINRSLLAAEAGWPHYVQFYTALRSEKVIATPRTVQRLAALAKLVGFPLDEVFLDGPLEPAAAHGGAR